MTKASRRKSPGTPTKGGRLSQNRERFDPKIFKDLARDLQDGTIPLKRITISDPDCVGLRAVIRDTGLISFHAHYQLDDSRPLLKIGEFPSTSIAEARELCRTVMSLADKGIDPQEGLHERLIRELKEKGDKWRP